MDYEPKRDDERIQRLVENPNLAREMLAKHLQRLAQEKQQQRKSRGLER